MLVVPGVAVWVSDFGHLVPRSDSANLPVNGTSQLVEKLTLGSYLSSRLSEAVIRICFPSSFPVSS